MPPAEETRGRIVRVNDGNDSNVRRDRVIDATQGYEHKFYNTAIPHDLEGFPGPVVLTANPGAKTDTFAYLLATIPRNLMFVRFRANTWNLPLCDEVVAHYTERDVPIVLTFMAYFETADKIPPTHLRDYEFRKRMLNSYWAIIHQAWCRVMDRYRCNPLVHSCGTEGVSGGSACRHCGNCLREYHATMERKGAWYDCIHRWRD